MGTAVDERFMERARELAAAVRAHTPPNPWVGAVVVSPAGEIVGEGATAPPGGPHAEATALVAAGARASGATLYVTLEPCPHVGLTPPCTDAVVAAGVDRVVVGIVDPDARVSGRGIDALTKAGVEVEVGVGADESAHQLAPYLKHRTTGRPFVVLKLAVTLDGRTAAPDGTSKWITGPEARGDVHQLRAESDAILVGAGTIAADDPELTARVVPAVPDERQPFRVVLGKLPAEGGARAEPATEMEGDLGAVLDELGKRDVLQLLVEGGAKTAHGFHAAGLVDRYVFYLAPALLGGSDGHPVLDGAGVRTMAGAWRGRLVDVVRLGADIKVVVEPLVAKGQVG